MRTIALSAPLRSDTENLLGKFVNEADYDTLVSEPTRVLKPDGSLLLILCRPGLSLIAGDAMYRAIRNRIPHTDNRGDASGLQKGYRRGADGKVSRTLRTMKGVQSGILGYFDRYAPDTFLS